MSEETKNIMLVAGEASGDHRGAEVAVALLKKNPQLNLYGVGGDEMRQAGVTTIFDVSDLAVMGFVEPLMHLPKLLKIFRTLKTDLQRNKPSLLILIDYPGFNLRLAKAAKEIGIKVLFYISPQVWAWRQGRVKKIASVVDHMAVIFPFEEKFYQEHNVDVTYVGHPLSQTLPHEISKQEACQKLQLDEDLDYITLLPGSRTSEVERLLPEMLHATKLLHKQFPKLYFLLVVASTIPFEKIKQRVAEEHDYVQLVQKEAYQAIAASDLVITASGTATLETALLNRPMVIVYKVNRFTGWLAKKLIKIPYVSLCNIVAGKKIMPELLQEQATVENITNEVSMILKDKNNLQNLKDELSVVRANLGQLEAANNVAKVALDMLQ